MQQVGEHEAAVSPAATEVDGYKLLSDMLGRNNRWAEVADAKAGAVLFFVGATSRILIEPIIDSAIELYDAGLNKTCPPARRNSSRSRGCSSRTLGWSLVIPKI